MTYKEWLAYHKLPPTGGTAVAARYTAYRKAHGAAPTGASAGGGGGTGGRTPPKPYDDREYIMDPGFNRDTMTNAGYENEINRITTERGNLQGQYNLSRLDAAQAIQKQLERSGLWNPNASVMDTIDEAGNKKYDFSTAGKDWAEGTAYKGAFRNANNSAAARGFGSSSDRWDAWTKSRSALNNQQASAMEAYRGQQNQSIRDQQTKYNELTGQINAQDTAYLGWRGGQQASTVNNPGYNPNPGGTPPAGSSSSATGARTSNRKVYKAGTLPGANTLKKMYPGYKASRAGNGDWLVTW